MVHSSLHVRLCRTCSGDIILQNICIKFKWSTAAWLTHVVPIVICHTLLGPDPHTRGEGLVNFASQVCELFATVFWACKHDHGIYDLHSATMRHSRDEHYPVVACDDNRMPHFTTVTLQYTVHSLYNMSIAESATWTHDAKLTRPLPVCKHMARETSLHAYA